MFYVYLIAGPSGRQYIGKTGDPAKRWAQHKTRKSKTYLSRAMQKHGVTQFTFGIICTSRTESDAYECEKLIIEQTKAHTPLYNTTKGGEGVLGLVHSLSARQRISDALRKRIRSPESARKTAEAQRGVPKKPCSEERKRKLSEMYKGRKPHPNTIAANCVPCSEETKAKIGAANRGRKPAPGVQEKATIAAAAKNRGGKWSEEQREKMRISIERRNANPEYRAKLSVAATRQHARARGAR